ncbi:MAG: [FeFe] hydrogenase H-cluster radical SAM maturase HydE [Paraprevotella sp.]|nr:[FeFe] hydrogenase H-cluster radical SAM maturase HydE [Paraprevotella sp.]
MNQILMNISDASFSDLLDKVSSGAELDREEWRMLLDRPDESPDQYLRARATEVARQHFGNGIYLRGLIEITSWCRNNCYYCGLRRSNRFASRYRLTTEDILSCCREGAGLGLNTFVLQGGEDDGQDDNWIENTIRAIRAEIPDQAITLSVGERSEDAYRRFREAGADRYLLRHETRNDAHYAQLHPAEMSASHRRACLRTLKALNFQTGAGMMIGTPGQTTDCLLDDIAFLEELRPQMIGIGPFIPAAHTPFAHRQAGSIPLTLRLVALMRLRFPHALIPSTTALATLNGGGRAAGILSGANVVMPNLSPLAVRGQYSIYDHKACQGGESATGLRLLEQELNQIGSRIVYGRGDYST